MIGQIMVSVVGAYLSCGVLFAIPFIVKGVRAIDEGAQGATLGFRIIILPGTIVIWPLRKRHFQIWLALGVLIPAGIATSWLSVKQPAHNSVLQPVSEEALPNI